MVNLLFRGMKNHFWLSSFFQDSTFNLLNLIFRYFWSERLFRERIFCLVRNPSGQEHRPHRLRDRRSDGEADFRHQRVRHSGRQERRHLGRPDRKRHQVHSVDRRRSPSQTDRRFCNVRSDFWPDRRCSSLWRTKEVKTNLLKQQYPSFDPNDWGSITSSLGQIRLG